MKVVCIKEFKSQCLQYELTKDKIYDVVPSPKWVQDNSYFLICDRGFVSSYNKSSFVTLEEYREGKLKEIGL